MSKSKSGRFSIGTIHESNSCGKFEIINYVTSKDITIRFLSTGYVRKTSTAKIVTKHIKDHYKPSVRGVGYIGCGEFSGSNNKNNIHKEIYDSWNRMLQRCYCEKFLKYRPSYQGCSVCDEWLNFQNFARWYIDNYPKDGKGYHLDKDVKIKGNKIYSPETCKFITGSENSAEAFSRYRENAKS